LEFCKAASECGENSTTSEVDHIVEDNEASVNERCSVNGVLVVGLEEVFVKDNKINAIERGSAKGVLIAVFIKEHEVIVNEEVQQRTFNFEAPKVWKEEVEDEFKAVEVEQRKW
jgi:Holliday junction resolvasome RuvABC endonuclease subunit